MLPLTRPDAHADAERIPWEQRGELGLVRAFWQTLLLSAREPNRFYALAPRDASPWPAIAYGLVFEMLVSCASFAYDRTIGTEEFGSALATIGPQLDAALPGAAALLERLHEGSSFASLLFAPGSYLLELGVTAGVTWVGLRLIGSLRTSFGALVRILAYASWVRIFGLIGVSDDVLLACSSSLLTFGFGAYYWVVAVKQSQGIDTQRAVYASLAGGAVAAAVGFVVLVPPLVLAIVWAVSKMDLPALPK
jgi:hypothetical protein